MADKIIVRKDGDERLVFDRPHVRELYESRGYEIVEAEKPKRNRRRADSSADAETVEAAAAESGDPTEEQ